METTGARAGAEAEAETRTGVKTQASRTVLRILCKISLEYLGIFVAASGATVMGGFVLKGPAGGLDNLSPNLGGKKEPRGATEGATEGVTERHS